MNDPFKKAEDDYFRLKGRLAAHKITPEQFQAELKELMRQDAQGRWWMLGVESGKWYVNADGQWTEAQPPLQAASGATAPLGDGGLVAPAVAPRPNVAAPRVPAAPAGSTLASFWRRAGAWLIDSALLLALGVCLFVALGAGLTAAKVPFNPASERIALLALYGVEFLLSSAYLIGFWTARGQTIGKMALGIKIEETQGASLTFGKAVLRYLGLILSAIPFGLGYWWVLWDPQQQAWHDKIAGTHVVRVK